MDISLKLGRLEDKFHLYQPTLDGLAGLVTIADDLGKLRDDLGKLREDLSALKEANVEFRSTLRHMLEDQDKNCGDVIKVLNGKSTLLDELENRLIVVELDKKTMSGEITTLISQAESLKMQGWDLLFRIVPWALLFGVAVWATVKA